MAWTDAARRAAAEARKRHSGPRGGTVVAQVPHLGGIVNRRVPLREAMNRGYQFYEGHRLVRGVKG